MLVLIIPFNISYANQNKEVKFISEVESSLQHLVQIQKGIITIHPFLEKLQPIALVEADHFYIFDFDTLSEKYHFIKKDTIGFPMPKGVRASFPLACYNSRPACIVTKDIFESESGYVTIFHEFMH